jgi:hypothetical protein
MVRGLLRFFIIMAISISCANNTAVLHANDSEKKQFLTQEQASELAARLANEKCLRVFGRSPFTPELYKARLEDSRWHWGKIEPKGINGYSAKVEFSKDGSDENVKVAFSSDKADIDTDMDNISRRDVPIKKEVPAIQTEIIDEDK